MTNPAQLPLRIETLNSDDVKFLREMIVARMKEIEANKKLDPQERKVLTDKYRRLNAKLDRRFNKATGRDNPTIQFRHSVLGHVLLLDERIAGQPIENISGIPSSVALNRMIVDCKLVGVLGEHDGVRVLKDRAGVNEEVEMP